MAEDRVDNVVVEDEGDNPHLAAARRTHQGVDHVDALDEL